jgi:hypothetical protein
MECPKTLKWCEPYDGWYDTDTGLGNRILHWEIAYKLSKENKFEYEILIQKIYWPEYSLLHIPYTITFKENTKLPNKEKFINESTPIDVDTINDMFVTNNFKLYNNHYYSNFGYMSMNNDNEKIRPLSLIKIKDYRIEDYIRNEMKDVIGIHIRRNVGVKYNEEDLNSLPIDVRNKFIELRKKYPSLEKNALSFIQDKYYFNIIESILEINPNQKFFISTDLPYELILYYSDRFKNKIIFKDDMVKQINFFIELSDIHADFIGEYDTIKNIIDLFSLSFCKFLIKSNFSTWSEFAEKYRNQPSVFANEDIEDIIKKYNDSKWNQLGDYRLRNINFNDIKKII